ncbi:MAG: hypothetical protein CL572_06855 [Alphaproteobacteria bacterium]|nr:hypothetical protein [Alphaproteobacteria bacterium]
MFLFRNFVIFTFLLLLSTTLEAHGPSRQKVSEKIQINAETKNVWEIVKNFKDFKWNKEIVSCSGNESTVGSERLIEFSNGSKVKQKLEKLDDDKMMIGWRIIETDNRMLPVNSYAAKVFVKKNNDKTIINYKAGFYRGFMGNDPPEELNDENSKKKVQEFIKKSLEGLKEIAEKN